MGYLLVVLHFITVLALIYVDLALAGNLLVLWAMGIVPIIVCFLLREDTI